MLSMLVVARGTGLLTTWALPTSRTILFHCTRFSTMEQPSRSSFVETLQSIFKEILDDVKKGSSILDSSITVNHCEDLLQGDRKLPTQGPPQYDNNLIYSMDLRHNNILYYATLNGSLDDNSTEIKPPPQKPEKEDPLLAILGTLFPNNEEPTPMPQKPYYKEIAKMIGIWAKTGTVPVRFERMSGLEEVEDDTQRLQTLTPLVVSLLKSQEKQQVINVLNELKIRGLLTLLRVRKTKGSIDVFPPSCKEMLESFNLPHTPSKPLTVGARALAKHCIRCKDGWWGDDRGPDPLKNKKATEVLLKIWGNAVWLNIHLLPHDIRIFEVRHKEGYGARWSHDGTMFRGFLEPQMENGHEVGWIH